MEKWMKVLNGLLKLSPAERKRVLEELERHEKSLPSERKRIEEGIAHEVTLGPVGQGCPCCGR
jgi:hypothetical protein